MVGPPKIQQTTYITGSGGTQATATPDTTNPGVRIYDPNTGKQISSTAPSPPSVATPPPQTEITPEKYAAPTSPDYQTARDQAFKTQTYAIVNTVNIGDKAYGIDNLGQTVELQTGKFQPVDINAIRQQVEANQQAQQRFQSDILRTTPTPNITTPDVTAIGTFRGPQGPTKVAVITPETPTDYNPNIGRLSLENPDRYIPAMTSTGGYITGQGYYDTVTGRFQSAFPSINTTPEYQGSASAYNIGFALGTQPTIKTDVTGKITDYGQLTDIMGLPTKTIQQGTQQSGLSNLVNLIIPEAQAETTEPQETGRLVGVPEPGFTGIPLQQTGPQTEGVISAYQRGGINGVTQALYNDLTNQTEIYYRGQPIKVPSYLENLYTIGQESSQAAQESLRGQNDIIQGLANIPISLVSEATALPLAVTFAIERPETIPEGFISGGQSVIQNNIDYFQKNPVAASTSAIAGLGLAFLGARGAGEELAGEPLIPGRQAGAPLIDTSQYTRPITQPIGRGLSTVTRPVTSSVSDFVTGISEGVKTTIRSNQAENLRYQQFIEDYPRLVRQTENIRDQSINQLLEEYPEYGLQSPSSTGLSFSEFQKYSAASRSPGFYEIRGRGGDVIEYGNRALQDLDEIMNTAYKPASPEELESYTNKFGRISPREKAIQDFNEASNVIGIPSGFRLLEENVLVPSNSPVFEPGLLPRLAGLSLYSSGMGSIGYILGQLQVIGELPTSETIRPIGEFYDFGETRSPFSSSEELEDIISFTPEVLGRAKESFDFTSALKTPVISIGLTRQRNIKPKSIQDISIKLGQTPENVIDTLGKQDQEQRKQIIQAFRADTVTGQTPIPNIITKSNGNGGDTFVVTSAEDIIGTVRSPSSFFPSLPSPNTGSIIIPRGRGRRRGYAFITPFKTGLGDVLPGFSVGGSLPGISLKGISLNTRRNNIVSSKKKFRSINRRKKTRKR